MKWRCIKKETCNGKGKAFCGLLREKPIVRSYHPSDEELEECYLQHVILCWEQWCKLKHRFVGTITRRFATTLNINLHEYEKRLPNDIEQALSFAILHHDVGKLTKEYQEEKWYRHEIIGAYLLYNIFSHEFAEREYGHYLSNVIGAAIYLHHEAIQLSRGWLKLRSPTLDYLLSKIGHLRFTFESYAQEIFNLATLLMGSKKINYSLPQNVEGKQIAMSLGRIICSLDSMPRINATRLCIASFLLPITQVDNKAAEIGRGSK